MRPETFLLKDSAGSLNKHNGRRATPTAVTEAGRAALSDGGKSAENAALKKRIKEMGSKNEELRDTCSKLSKKLNAEEIINGCLKERLDSVVSALETERVVSRNAEKTREETIILAGEAYDDGILIGKKESEEEIAELRRQIGKLRATAVERTDGLGSVRWFDGTSFRSDMFTAESYIPLADLGFGKVVLKPAEAGRGIECRNNTVDIPGIEAFISFIEDSDLRAECTPDGRITVFMEE